MGVRAEVFISATTRELRSYREEVKNALLTLGIFPIEQTNFRLAHGPLTAKLRSLIAPCDAVIHLAGFYYGVEPSQRPSAEPRRSYTQIEYDVARELRHPLFLFLAAKNCEFDDCPEQSEEERTLQLAHRRVIEECDDVYYSFANHEDLARFVRELDLPARSPSRRVANLPYLSLGPLFKGRDTALIQLRQGLTAGEGRAVGLTARQAVHGLGGVGKTRLAVEYAWRHASDHKDALLFVSALSPVDLRANLAELCSPAVLNLPEWNQLDEIVRLAAVFRWLSEHSGWLLILDNADTPEAAAEVEKTLPQLQGGGVIITSRIADWITAVQPVELDVLAEEDAVAFLLERTESRRKKILTDGEDAAVVARDLGGLALALEQGGAYIAKIRVSFSEYRRRWESRKEEVLAWHDERLMQYPKSVATTWRTTIEELSRLERKLLNILAWFAPEPITLSLLEGYIVDGTDARDALAGLASWSLARWMADGEGFTVHRLVQEITRQRLPDNEKSDALHAAFGLLNARLPSPDWDEKGWQLWEQLAPRYRALLDHLSGHVLEPKAVRIMNQYGVWLQNRGQYTNAESIFQRALAINTKVLGKEHPDTLAVMLNLAGTLYAQGNLVGARTLQEQVLEASSRLLGKEHPDTLTSMNNLAQTLKAQGDLAGARTLEEQVLEASARLLGKEHPDTLKSMNNLAQTLKAQGDLAGARPLEEQVLEASSRLLGKEHPDTLTSMNNLAQTLKAQGDLAGARTLEEQVLEASAQLLGKEHPDTLTAMLNLAQTLYAQGDLAGARTLQEQVLEAMVRLLGKEHPDTLNSMNNLAGTLKAQGDLAKARPLQEQVLEAMARLLGKEHPDTLKSMNNLAQTLKAQGDLAGARPLQEQVLEARARLLGKEHPDTLTAMLNLAGTLYAQGDLAGARTLEEQVLEARARLLGKEHPDALTSMNNLAGTLYAQGDLAGARTLQEQVLEAMARLLGKEHPDALTSMNNLAKTLYAQGDLAGARTLQEQVLEARTRLLGEKHPATLNSMLNLASLYYTENKYAKAESLHRQVLRILAEFGHRADEHPHFRTAINNYAVLLAALGLSETEILARLRSAIESEPDELA